MFVQSPPFCYEWFIVCVSAGCWLSLILSSHIVFGSKEAHISEMRVPILVSFFYYTPTLYFESYKEYGFTLLANHIHMGFLCVSQRQLTIESIYDSEPSSGGGQQRTVGGDDKSHWLPGDNNLITAQCSWKWEFQCLRLRIRRTSKATLIFISNRLYTSIRSLVYHFTIFRNCLNDHQSSSTSSSERLLISIFHGAAVNTLLKSISRGSWQVGSVCESFISIAAR